MSKRDTARMQVQGIREHRATQATARAVRSTKGVANIPARRVARAVGRSDAGRIMRQITFAAIIGAVVLRADSVSSVLKWGTTIFRDVSRLAEK